MKRRSLLLGSAVLLAGCGGSGSRVSSGPGRAVFTVEWPKGTTRLIPAASQSIAVEIRQNGNLLARQVLAKPGTTLTFADLPEGDLIAFAAAYPTTDGTGTPQASGTVPLAIIDGQTVQVPLTMASTIAKLEASPNQIGVGETRRIIAVARDLNNAVVLISPGQVQYTLENNSSSISWVQATHLVTGLSPGSILIRCTDSESGVSTINTIQIISESTLPTTIKLPPLGYIVPDPSRYLLWSQNPSRLETIHGIDPETGTIIESITVPNNCFISTLSHLSDYLYLNTIDSSECKILDISLKSIQPNRLQIPNRPIRCIGPLPVGASADDRILVTQSTRASDSATFVSIFDIDAKRPEEIIDILPTAASVHSNGSLYYKSFPDNGRISIEKNTIDGNGFTSTFFSSISPGSSIVSSSEFGVVSNGLQQFDDNTMSPIRSLEALPTGNRISKSARSANRLHSLIQVDLNQKSFYCVHNLDLGSIESFVELPFGGVLPPTSALILYGYTEIHILRNFIALRNVTGNWTLRKVL